jgi:hypothetical protein
VHWQVTRLQRREVQYEWGEATVISCKRRKEPHKMLTKRASVVHSTHTHIHIHTHSRLANLVEVVSPQLPRPAMSTVSMAMSVAVMMTMTKQMRRIAHAWSSSRLSIRLHSAQAAVATDFAQCTVRTVKQAPRCRPQH